MVCRLRIRCVYGQIPIVSANKFIALTVLPLRLFLPANSITSEPKITNMEPKEQPDAEELEAGKKVITKYAKYSGLVFQMIAIIGAFTFAGYKIDQARQAKTPLATAFLSLAGVIISLYLVIRSIKTQKP